MSSNHRSRTSPSSPVRALQISAVSPEWAAMKPAPLLRGFGVALTLEPPTWLARADCCLFSWFLSKSRDDLKVSLALSSKWTISSFLWSTCPHAIVRMVSYNMCSSLKARNMCQYPLVIGVGFWSGSGQYPSLGTNNRWSDVTTWRKLNTQ